MIKRIFLSIIGLFLLHTSIAQTAAPDNELWLTKLAQYKKNHPSIALFAHIDKTIYTNNEIIWFSAYLISNTAQNLKNHNILYVSLIKADTRDIVLMGKYVMENGLSFGSLNLPDTIASGNYELLASTNVLEKNSHPLCTFSQPVIVKNMTLPVSDGSTAGQNAISTPNKTKQTDIKFYPEGGNLIAGLAGTIGWETKSSTGSPLKLKAALLKDKLSIDTIETNEYGMGTFQLIPDEKSKYAIKIIGNNSFLPDSSYSLPTALSSGINLRLAQAIVKDTLQFKLFSKSETGVHVLIHNYQDAYASFSTTALPTGKKVSIALNALPKGIATITVLDKNNQPLAERLFFAHYDQKITTNLSLNKSSYRKRDSVKIKLKLTNKSGQPVQGILSAAIVQSIRLNEYEFPDIESHTYLYQALNLNPLYEYGRSLQEKPYLENVMLIKGWRKYTWQELISSTGNDTVPAPAPAVLNAQFKYKGKPLKAPLDLIIQNNPAFTPIKTNNTGYFDLDRENLIVPADKKIGIFINSKNSEGYTLSVIDPFTEINKRLARQLPIYRPDLGKHAEPDANIKKAGLEAGQTLKTVNISAKNSDGSFYGTNKIPGANECGDYVDARGYLNYPGSAGNSANYQPIEGKQYLIRTDLGSTKFEVRPISYMGCTTKKEQNSFKIDGIHLTKEFYVANAGSPEPEYATTLLWKPGITTNAQGEAEIECLTSDITGNFRIILQGISRDNVIFTTGNFKVD
ncbi:hypothetical protein [Pedobacter heparinus]|uniref:hypothetical protein n=1 Tax=Pedobacter heparinus TaxID=984 RepID=UPI00292DCF9B|nr:hypothetical protein [Pedobacter heparinus]